MSMRLPELLWKTIQYSVPIFCVDVIPMRLDGRGGLELGLILREAPGGSERWCVIGGRLLLDETIAAAVDRELSSALGETLTRDGPDELPPLIVEYRRHYAPGHPYDPRQHAISATVPVWMTGEGVSQGAEAHEFRWWNASELNGDVMGFGQETLVPRLMAANLGRLGGTTR